ncbi:hypothetical protein [Streptomyces sp. NPDC001933]|uniref:hypothetical protein n=1 Tax=Streptomyces sp. NPDC001933 TaxID=3364626 RepID=UPI00369AD230
MKPLTRIRSSSATRVAPVVLLLMFAYYFTDIRDDLRLDPLGYAPTVIDAVQRNLLPVSYAVAAALGAWEARRLGRADIWQWGAVRSRYTIAAHSLAPVVVLAWLATLMPTVWALIQTGTPLNLWGFGLLVFGMVPCIAHAVIGFAMGVRVRHIAVVPVVAVVDFLAVGWSVALESPWPRHLSGLYTGKLMFGELPTATSIVAPLLLALGVATGVVLLWSSTRWRWLRTAVAGVLALASVAGAYSMVKDWSYIAPRSAGHGEMSCAGEAPRICTPTVYAQALPSLRKDVGGALHALREAGIDARPVSMTDTLAAIRYQKRSTATAWQLPLAASHATGTTRYHVARAAVRFDCAEPATGRARLVYYWVSMRVGQGDAYLRRLATEPDFTAKPRNRLKSRVGDVLAMTPEQQTSWYRQTVASACEKAT